MRVANMISKAILLTVLSVVACTSIAFTGPKTATIFSKNKTSIGSGVVVRGKTACLLITAAHVTSAPSVDFAVGKSDERIQADIQWEGKDVGVDIVVYASQKNVCDSAPMPHPIKSSFALDSPIGYLLTRSPSGSDVYKLLFRLEGDERKLLYAVTDNSVILEGASGSPVFASGTLVGIFIGTNVDGSNRVERLDEVLRSDTRLFEMLVGSQSDSGVAMEQHPVFLRIYKIKFESNKQNSSQQAIPSLPKTGLDLYIDAFRALPVRSANIGMYPAGVLDKVKEKLIKELGGNLMVRDGFDEDFNTLLEEWLKIGLISSFQTKDNGIAYTRSLKGEEFIRRIEGMRAIDPEVWQQERLSLRSQVALLNNQLESIRKILPSSNISKDEFDVRVNSTRDLMMIPDQVISVNGISSSTVTGYIAGRQYEIHVGSDYTFSIGKDEYRLLLLSTNYTVSCRFRLEKRVNR